MFGAIFGPGFTPIEVFRLTAALMGGSVLMLAVVFLTHAYEASKPALRIERHPGEIAVVQGISVTVQVYQDRDRPACADARADRVMIHVPDGKSPDDGEFDGIQFLRESRVAPTRKGHHVFTMFLTLSSPLPAMPSGSWYYQANIFNGCDWIKRMLGGEAPIPTPAVPVRIVG